MIYILNYSGVCLETLHVYQDQLCKDQKFSKIERPKLGPPISSGENITETLVADIKQVYKR